MVVARQLPRKQQATALQPHTADDDIGTQHHLSRLTMANGGSSPAGPVEVWYDSYSLAAAQIC